MKKTSRRFLSLLLALLLIGSLSVQAFAVVPPQYDFKTGTKTLNLNGVSGKTTFTVCFASGKYAHAFLSADDITFNNGTTDASVTRLYYKEDLEIKELDTDPMIAGENRKTHTIKYYVTFTASKAGIASISCKYQGRTYTLKLKIEGYSNRIKSITLTGVNGGKNFASLTKNYATARSALPLNATVKNPVLSITAASGSKILKVTVKDNTSGATMTLQYSGSGVSSVTMPFGALSVKHKYTVSIVTTGSRTTQYTIVGAKA